VIETTFLHYQSDQVANLDRTARGGMTTMRRLADVAGLYARFWDPTVVFMFGAPWLMHSTRRAGILLIAAAGVIVVGSLTLAGRSLRDSRVLMVLGGFLLAPVPASLVDINEHSALHATWRRRDPPVRVHHLYVIETSDRDSLKDWLRARQIDMGIHYPIPVHLQAAWQGLARPGDFPATERAAGRILSLPMYAELTPGQIDCVTGAIEEFLSRRAP
jgi:hypothetical protein